MKKILISSLILIWLFSSTLLLCRFWYSHPDFFPIKSGHFWEIGDKLFGAKTVNDQESVELFMTIFVSFLTTALFTCLAGIVGFLAIKKR